MDDEGLTIVEMAEGAGSIAVELSEDGLVMRMTAGTYTGSITFPAGTLVLSGELEFRRAAAPPIVAPEV